MRVENRCTGVCHRALLMGESSAVLALPLRRGSIEMGPRRSQMRRLTYDADEMSLVARHSEKWLRNEDSRSSRDGSGFLSLGSVRRLTARNTPATGRNASVVQFHWGMMIPVLAFRRPLTVNGSSEFAQSQGSSLVVSISLPSPPYRCGTSIGGFVPSDLFRAPGANRKTRSDWSEALPVIG